MKLIDTHVHLYVEEFDPDRKEVIERAREIGIDRFFLPAIDSTYYQRMFELKKEYPDQVFLMAGLHPTHVDKDFEKELEIVRGHLDSKDFVAIGEIGIDLYWDKTHFKEQQQAFRTQIDWALDRDLPIVIHARNSFDEIFSVLSEYPAGSLRGIFHCFTGTEQQAERALGFGLHLGIGGVVTFKNGGIDKFLNKIPLERIVLETDAPYLAPTPLRGKRNESANLAYIVKKLAEIYGIGESQISDQTSRNALALFGF